MYKIFLIIFLIILDLFVKQVIYRLIELNNFIKISSFLDLAHIHNFGIAFGLFSNLFPSWLFVIVASIVTVFLFILFIKSKKFLEKWGYICILAGGLSNILDRAINGYVLDYIYLHYKEFYWPAFNFADVYISIGLCILLIEIFRDLKIRNIK